MDADTIIRFFHISSGIVWAGGVFASAWFITPAAQKAGPAAGAFMGALAKGSLRPVMMAASAVTALAGITLWIRHVEGAPSGVEGALLSIGTLAGLVAVVIGHGFQARTGKALAGMVDEMGGNPPNEEQAGRLGVLQGQMMKYGNWLSWLMVIAIIGMTLGSA